MEVKPNFTLTLRFALRTRYRPHRQPVSRDSTTQFPGSGTGNRVTQPNKNFAPEVGFAWDPAKNGKTSIRGGVGLFWENAIWNNVLFDGPYREAKGAFLQNPSPCSAAGVPAPIQTSTGTITATSAVCGTGGNYPLIGNALPALLAFQAQYQAASALNLQQPNPNYAGQYLNGTVQGVTYNCQEPTAQCYFAPGNSMFNPNYRSPRSIVMNLGVQREIRPGTVLSVDFIRNVQTHFLLGVDQNHAGDIGTFNVTAAQQAIQATLANCGAASIAASIFHQLPARPRKWIKR